MVQIHDKLFHHCGCSQCRVQTQICLSETVSAQVTLPLKDQLQTIQGIKVALEGKPVGSRAAGKARFVSAVVDVAVDPRVVVVNFLRNSAVEPEAWR